MGQDSFSSHTTLDPLLLFLKNDFINIYIYIYSYFLRSGSFSLTHFRLDPLFCPSCACLNHLEFFSQKFLIGLFLGRRTSASCLSLLSSFLSVLSLSFAAVLKLPF